MFVRMKYVVVLIQIICMAMLHVIFVLDPCYSFSTDDMHGSDKSNIYSNFFLEKYYFNKNLILMTGYRYNYQFVVNLEEILSIIVQF
jgi:hypothetical protein